MSKYSGKKGALIIGNSAYSAAGVLVNPENDARRISGVLEGLGFDVHTHFDVGYTCLINSIREYLSSTKNADVSVFFYAGHGLQANGKNYLLPVDSNIKSITDLNFGALAFDDVVNSLTSQYKINICFLDACRDNPFVRSILTQDGTRSVSTGRGLASIGPVGGTFIAFATEPGNVAYDGDEDNSPFTDALCNRLAESKLSLTDVMMKVTGDVLTITDSKQRPWQQHSLTENIYLNGSDSETKVDSPTRDTTPEAEMPPP